MTWLKDSNTKLNKPTVINPLERVVVLHSSDELPKDRRECLVATYFDDEAYLAKYNEVTEYWMVAFEKEMSMTSAQIRAWVYVNEIFPIQPNTRKIKSL